MENTRKLFVATFSVLLWLPSIALASNICAPFKPNPMAGFEALDPLIYADLPDGDVVRATSAIDVALIDKQIKGSLPPLTKRWCQIGVQQMVVDFEVPVEDDAVSAEITRAVYVWDTSGDPIGWRIEKLGKRFRCARGENPFANICP